MPGDQADNVHGELSVNNLFSNSPAMAGTIREITRQSSSVGLVQQLGLCREHFR
jgi:ribosomal protein S14